MAEFNPQTNVVIQNGWIGASDGQIPNRAFGTLFEGAGAIMKKREDAKQDALQAAVQREVDALGDEIVGKDVDPSLFEKSTDRNPSQSSRAYEVGAPFALSSAESKLGKLKTAYEQGTLSDGYYMTRVRHLSKKLRADYPQYTDKIDDLLANAIGTSSANALRKEFNSQFDADTASMSEDLKATYSLVQSNLELAGDTEVQALYEANTGKKLDLGNIEGLDRNSLIEAFSARKAKDAQLARETAALARLNSSTESGKKEFKRIAVKRAIELSESQSFVASVNGLNKLMEDSLASGGTIDPTERKNIEAEIAKAEVAVNLGVDGLLKQFPQLTEEADRKDVSEAATRSFNIIKSALKNDNLGIVKFLTDQHTAKKMLIDIGILGNVDNSIALGLTIKQYGEKPTNDAFLLQKADPDLYRLDKKAQAIVAYYFSMQMAGDSPTEQLAQSETNGDPKAFLPAFQSYIKVLSGDITTDEKVREAAEALFGEKEEKLLSLVDPASAETLFNLMMNPALQAKLVGSPVAGRVYDWALKQGKVLLLEEAGALKAAQKYTDDVTVVYDKGRFNVISANETTGKGMWPFEPRRLYAGREAARKMNLFLDKMEPLFKEAKGDMNIESFLTSVFEGEDFKDLQKEGSFFSRMGESFHQMNKTMDENAKKVDEKPPVRGEPNVRGLRLDKKSELDDPTLNLIDFVYGAEGADYETMYGGKKADLTKMQVSEILTLGKKRGKSVGSSALGASQVITETLQGLVNQGVVDEDDKFTQEVQDKITLALMNEKGLQKFKKGKISLEVFADRLADVWASLPKASGKSAYHGDKMGNKATVSREALLEVLKKFEA